MNTADPSALAHHLFEEQGPKAIAQAAQKAVALETSGDGEKARFWRQVESILCEMRGPRQS